MTKSNEKWIDLLKWFISSVCIVIVTIVIDSGFKEREAGIKEMEVYDKYVEIILQADNIEQRWKLCEYFSIVTPTERLRNRWKAYKDTISEDYYTWKSKQYLDTSMSVISDPNDKPLITNTSTDKSQIYELNGFNFLLNKDVNGAISAFKDAEESKNGLHNCYEIHNYLVKNKSELEDTNSKKWQEFYNKLLTDWSWGMPNDIKQQLQSKI